MMIKKMKAQWPILGSLMESGVIYREGNEYVGKASDGAIVSLGYSTRDLTGRWSGEEALENYLRSHPTPDTW